MAWRRLPAVLLALFAAPAPGVAATGGGRGIERPAQICERAAARAARAAGVPVNVLRALTLAETGRKRDGVQRPWAWTVNMEGVGRWFDDRAAALAFVRERHAKGARSYDVGCFQINYRWHGAAFESVESMFDPDLNAAYAARFIKELHAETGSWEAAAAFYHSRTPKYAKRYRARFERILASLGSAPAMPAPGLTMPGAAPRDRTRPRVPIPPGGPLIALISTPGGAGSLAVRPPDAARQARRGSLAGLAMARGGGLLASARPLFN